MVICNVLLIDSKTVKKRPEVFKTKYSKRPRTALNIRLRDELAEHDHTGGPPRGTHSARQPSCPTFEDFLLVTTTPNWPLKPRLSNLNHLLTLLTRLVPSCSVSHKHSTMVSNGETAKTKTSAAQYSLVRVCRQEVVCFSIGVCSTTPLFLKESGKKERGNASSLSSSRAPTPSDEELSCL